MLKVEDLLRRTVRALCAGPQIRGLCARLSWERARAPIESTSPGPGVDSQVASSSSHYLNSRLTARARAGLGFRQAQSPAQCIAAMEASSGSAGRKLRVFGMVKLVKELQLDRARQWMTLDDAATVLRWLEPVTASSTRGASTAVVAALALGASEKHKALPALSPAPLRYGNGPGPQLTVRQATALLHAVAKLKRGKRGWHQLLQDARMQNLLDQLIESLSSGTLQLDPQVPILPIHLMMTLRLVPIVRQEAYMHVYLGVVSSCPVKFHN
jgi:hypothetical protein